MALPKAKQSPRVLASALATDSEEEWVTLLCSVTARIKFK